MGFVSKAIGNVITGSEKLFGLKPAAPSLPKPIAPPNPAITANAGSAAGASRKAAGVATAGGTVATSPEGLSEPPKTAGVTLLGGGQ